MATTIEQRNRLFNQYLPLANKLASNKKKHVPRSVRLEELMSAAQAGLLDAASKYNETMDQQFRVYAAIRIMGEMNDYLRTCTWGNRSHMMAGWSLDTPVRSTKTKKLVSLEDGLTDELTFHPMERTEFFNKFTQSLPKEIKDIFFMYFFETLTMKEISLKIGMSESRISQVIASSKELLREAWEGRQRELWDMIAPPPKREKFVLSLTPPDRKAA